MHTDAQRGRDRELPPRDRAERGTARTATRVLVLTTFDADELVLRALRAGADGFLLKDTPPAEIVRAIELVAGGDGILSPAVARRLIEHVAAEGAGTDARRAATVSASTRSPTESARSPRRSDRESPTPTSPRELYMSVATVKAHVTRVLSKLDADNRVQIALLVQDARL